MKPTALTEYLARLLKPPTGGALLVPFAGSGSEMVGARRAGWAEIVGIERERAYVEIARRRLGLTRPAASSGRFPVRRPRPAA